MYDLDIMDPHLRDLLVSNGHLDVVELLTAGSTTIENQFRSECNLVGTAGR